MLKTEHYEEQEEKPIETQKIKRAYSKVISDFGNEFNILHHAPLENIQRNHAKLAIAIEWLRNNQKHFTAGFDGKSGRIYFFDGKELNTKAAQMALF